MLSIKEISLPIALLFAACTPSEMNMLSGNPEASLDLAKGTGTVQLAQNGSTTFRYAFSKSGLDGIVAKQSQEAVRLDYISQFVGSQNICNSGWKITNRYEFDANLLYEGTCL